MSAPSPRPTREQVEAALAYADKYSSPGPTWHLAAEVRAVRVELEAGRPRTDWETRPYTSAVTGVATVRGDLTALTARTPQPAELTTGTPDDPNRAPCPHCEDGHQDPRTVPWGVWVAPDRDSDGQPTHLRVGRTQGSHVAQSDADWLWNLIRNYRAAPQPAVPDGEPATVDEMEGHFLDANERMGEALVAIGMALGLPRPGVGVRWGAAQILARIAESGAGTGQPAALHLQVVDVGPGRGCARVEGRCPTCGVRSLFLGAGARVTCASLSCTDPCAVDSYLDSSPRGASS